MSPPKEARIRSNRRAAVTALVAVVALLGLAAAVSGARSQAVSERYVFGCDAAGTRCLGAFTRHGAAIAGFRIRACGATLALPPMALHDGRFRLSALRRLGGRRRLVNLRGRLVAGGGAFGWVSVSGRGCTTRVRFSARLAAGAQPPAVPIPSPPVVTTPTAPAPPDPPPPPTITSAPASPTREHVVTIGFSDSRPDASFLCAFDDGPSGPCSSPFQVEAAADGPHHLDVTAVVGASAPSAPARATWTLDATPPAAPTLTSPLPPTTSASRSISIAFADADATTAGFLCRIDAAPLSPCTSPAHASGLQAGAPHRFTVEAVDALGNASAPTLFDWTVSGASTDPTIGAAGDIACDFDNAHYQHPTASACHDGLVSDLVVGQDFSALLVLGDNQYFCGSAQAYQTAYDPTWGRVKQITYPVPGNHEYITHQNTDSQGNPTDGSDCTSANAGAAGYFSYFGARLGQIAGDPTAAWYSFDLKTADGTPWHVVALDSYCDPAAAGHVDCTQGSQQWDWLQADLAAHPNSAYPCTIAFFHHPLFLAPNSSVGSTAAVKPLWDLLYAAGADIVLNGHAHDYERFMPQDALGNSDPAAGITEYISGNGGSNHTHPTGAAQNAAVAPLDTKFGVLSLTLHDSGWDSVFLADDGTSYDPSSGVCH